MVKTNLAEFLKGLSESGKSGSSTYNLRNENEQVKSKVPTIPRLKKEKKKKSKLLVAMELAVPFNPLTGEADAEYNPDKKFRPQLSATTVGLMLKKQANDNQAVKDAFMRRANVTDWDTSDVEHLNTVDKKVFDVYRVPTIYTFPVVNINIPIMTGSFGRDYVIKVERDKITNQVIGEKQLALQANEFFRDMCYEEYKKFQDDIINKRVELTEAQQKDRIRDIFSKVPVSDDHPSNYFLAVELPLDNQYMLTGNYKDAADIDIKSMLVQGKRAAALTNALSKYLTIDNTKEWAKYDVHFDFVEIDMACPANTEDPMEIGKDTTWEKPQNTLEECGCNDAIETAFRSFFDGDDDLEQIMINSVRLAKYDETIENQLCSALSSVVDKDSEYLTKAVIARHTDFITIALGDMGSELLLELEMNDENRADGNLDSDDAAKVAKQVSLDQALNLDESMIDLDVVE